MLTICDQQIGLLEVLMYLMGIIAVIAAVAWNWDPVFLLLLIIVVLPFLTFWEIHNMEQEHDLSHRVRRTIPPNSLNDGGPEAERNVA